MKVSFIHIGREHHGIEWLSAVLKKHGHQVTLLCDPGIFSIYDNLFAIPRLQKLCSLKKEIIYELKRNKPDIIAATAYTPTYPWIKDILNEVRVDTPVPVILGGIHPTLVPERVVRDGCADYVVIGEGEAAMLEIIESIQRSETRTDILNSALRSGDTIICNPPRAPLQLDSLPLPDKELFREFLNRSDDYTIMTSRGCVYNCSFCYESNLNKLYANKFFRRRSIEHVMAELQVSKRRFKFRTVMFWDSIFFSDKKWLRELLWQYKRDIHVPFRCEGHVSFLDLETARMIKEAGCYCVNIGLQTLNEQLRKRLLNRNETQIQIDRALENCDRIKLKYDIDLLFDIPGQSTEDYEQTALYFGAKSYLNRLKMYNITFFPHLPLTTYAVEHELLSKTDMELIESGEMPGDFFHVDVGKLSDRKNKAGLKLLYKALPLLPASAIRSIVQKKYYARISSVPVIIFILTEAIVAVKNQDYRYLIHTKRYISTIIRIIRKKLKVRITKSANSSTNK